MFIFFEILTSQKIGHFLFLNVNPLSFREKLSVPAQEPHYAHFLEFLWASGIRCDKCSVTPAAGDTADKKQ